MGYSKRDCSVHGHSFSARYDVDYDKEHHEKNITKIMTKQTYIRDVCIYCGKIIERKE